eukprot:9358033-Lingulodinium_polyedra.AAC.1
MSQATPACCQACMAWIPWLHNATCWLLPAAPEDAIDDASEDTSEDACEDASEVWHVEPVDQHELHEPVPAHAGGGGSGASMAPQPAGTAFCSGAARPAANSAAFAASFCFLFMTMRNWWERLLRGSFFLPEHIFSSFLMVDFIGVVGSGFTTLDILVGASGIHWHITASMEHACSTGSDPCSKSAQHNS